MKRVLFSAATLVGLVGLLVQLPACSDSNTPAAAATGSISGKVTFAGTWPSIGEIQISIFSSYPPTGAPDNFTDPLPSGVTEYEYKLDGIDPGDYAAVVVGWRDPANPSGAKCVGIYWAHVDSVGVASNCVPEVPGPAPVTIRAGHTTSGTDIAADLSLIGTPSNAGSVAGRVTFDGAWPSTGDVQVSVFSTYPPTGPPAAFSNPIPPGAQYDYQLDGIDPGTYAAVVVGWRDSANPSGAKCVGIYWAYVDSLGVDGSCVPVPPGPTPVTVQTGQTRSGTDIKADLSLIP